jgi:hypothetical protein
MSLKSSKQVGKELRAWLASQSLTEAGLSERLRGKNKADHVSQSWISRICSGDFVRLSRKTRIVLAYANIRVEESVVIDPQGEQILQAAVSEVWDGSLRTAQALAGVLRSASRLAQNSP